MKFFLCSLAVIASVEGIMLDSYNESDTLTKTTLPLVNTLSSSFDPLSLAESNSLTDTLTKIGVQGHL